MSKQAMLVSGLLHLVAVSAATVYFSPRPGSVDLSIDLAMPVDLIPDEEFLIAPQVQKTLPPPEITTVATDDIANLEIRAAPLDPIDMEPQVSSVADVAPPAFDPALVGGLGSIIMEHARTTEERATGPALARQRDEFESLTFDREEWHRGDFDLRERLPEPVRRQGSRLALDMLGDILFERDSADLKPEARALIAAVAAELKRSGYTRLQVNGFTDTTGTYDYNLALSADRASAVADELVRNGIDPARIRVEGYGQDRLAVPTPPGVS